MRTGLILVPLPRAVETARDALSIFLGAGGSASRHARVGFSSWVPRWVKVDPGKSRLPLPQSPPYRLGG